MDVNAIDPGVDFFEAIEASVGSCDVLIAVVGKLWLISPDGQGNRRLDNPDDFVRLIRRRPISPLRESSTGYEGIVSQRVAMINSCSARFGRTKAEEEMARQCSIAIKTANRPADSSDTRDGRSQRGAASACLALGFLVLVISY
jgi:hypothetical protein